MPEEHCEEEKLVCFHCKKPFINPLIEEKNKVQQKARQTPKENIKNSAIVEATVNTERTHREGETQLYFTCPSCGVNLSVPEEHCEEEKFVCYHCKKSFNNPSITITGRTPLVGEPTYYLNCPNCNTNVSISEKQRNLDKFLCYYCKTVFKNPQIPKNQSFNFELDQESLKITELVVKKYFDTCDISKQISISRLYSKNEYFEMVANDNLVDISDSIEEFRSFISNEINNGSYDDLDISMSILKTYEEEIDFLADLEKIYKLIHKKGGNVSYPVLLKLFNDLLDEEINEETKLILDYEYLRIAGKLYTNISVRNVIKEFIKSPLDNFIDDNIVQQLLSRFNLVIDKEQINGLIEELKEEIDLEIFEQNLGKKTKEMKLADPRNLSGLEFEAFLKQLFEILGYTVIQTKLSGDQGADLVIMFDNIKTAVQAKRYSGKVSNKAIQEVVASKKHYKCENAMVVTTGKFTKSAVQLAISNEVELWDIKKLSKIISDINNSNKKNSIKNNENTFGNEPIRSNIKINFNNETFPFICPMCKKEIKVDVDILPDINKESSFECPECNFPFMLSLNVENYSCEHCHKQFKSIREHINHLKVCSVYKSKLYICDFCNAELILDDDEYEEYKKYGIVNAICPICNKKTEMRK